MPPQDTGDAGRVPRLVEHLFREQSGKMVATLARIFGLEHLGLAEDVVQEALARALQTWPFYGVPDNPAAWLMRAARNLALDALRREKVFRDKQAEIVWSMASVLSVPEARASAEEEVADDILRLMFVCCHPLLPPEAQVALALKTLCGFSPVEIASAFLTTETAIAKRLTRAKQKIREAGMGFEIPAGELLTERLNGVLQTIYLLFNEGYKASTGEKLVREDLCREALRLGGLLARHPATRRPKTHALLALMFLNAARLPSRVDARGNLLRLQDQDRTRWDPALIAQGMYHLALSAAGEAVSHYHLEAGIAACHCAAPDYASTDWRRILELYDRLCAIDDSPITALNRAVALAEVFGPEAGLKAVAGVRKGSGLDSYYLFHAVTGELEARLHRSASAAAHFRRSLELAGTESERAFLSRRLSAIGG